MENLDDTIERSSTSLSAHARRELNKGAGWVKAVAILGFIGSGMMVLASIGMFILLPVVGILYLIMAGVYGYISYLLYQKGKMASANSFNMDLFAENFHKFWKVTVIMMIILFVLSFVFGIIMGAVGGGSAFRF